MRRSAPTPLCERRYSGTFLVRTSPELHARLALEASEERVSMNQWIVQKLSGRTPSDTFGLFGFDQLAHRPGNIRDSPDSIGADFP
jgi:HicB-like protein involved in pilus formation